MRYDCPDCGAVGSVWVHQAQTICSRCSEMRQADWLTAEPENPNRWRARPVAAERWPAAAAVAAERWPEGDR